MASRKSRNIETDLFGIPVRADGINSKLKGNTNERVASGWASKWTNQKFTRVPSSGGLRWKNAVGSVGDIICENDDFEFLFSVETKHLAKIHIPSTLMGLGERKSQVFRIWTQAFKDATRASKEPMLLIRENGMPKETYLLFVDREIGELFTQNGIKCSSKGITSSYIEGKVEIFDIMGFASEDVLNGIPYSVVHDFLKNSYISKK